MSSEILRIKISPGAGSKEMSIKDFEDLAKEYVSREVSEDCVEVYPPQYLLSDNFPNDVATVSEYLKQCLTRSEAGESVSSIIKQYNPQYHRSLFVGKMLYEEKIDVNHLLVISSYHHLVASFQICEKVKLKEKLRSGNN